MEDFKAQLVKTPTHLKRILRGKTALVYVRTPSGYVTIPLTHVAARTLFEEASDNLMFLYAEPWRENVYLSLEDEKLDLS